MEGRGCFLGRRFSFGLKCQRTFLVDMHVCFFLFSMELIHRLTFQRYQLEFLLSLFRLSFLADSHSLPPLVLMRVLFGSHERH